MIEIAFWMWLADIAGSIGVVGVFACGAMAIACVLFALGVGFNNGEVPEQLVPFAKAMRWGLIPIAIAVATPSPTTIRMVAAARAADLTSQTQLGQKAIAAIDAILGKIVKEASK